MDLIYGYINRVKGENESLLADRKYDKIIYCDCNSFDFSFLKSGDTVIIQKILSISNELKDFLNFCQYAFDNEINVVIIDKSDDKYMDSIDTNTAMGKLIVGIMASVNVLDEGLYRKTANN